MQLAQEWVENHKTREKSYYFHLQNFSADMNTADFIGVCVIFSLFFNYYFN